MGGGTREVHRDSSPLATGTHKGGTSVTLSDQGAQFDVFVAQTGLAIENVTGGAASTIATLTADAITTAAAISWANGDTYKIYKTAAKNRKISTDWVDVSRGWKSDRKELTRGWREEDMDKDRTAEGGHRNVFGTGQPEKN